MKENIVYVIQEIPGTKTGSPKINIIGAENLLNSAINAGVKKVIALSTDKAVYPINAMGISKVMMERVIV